MRPRDCEPDIDTTADSKRFDKLIQKASSVSGLFVDSVQAVGERRTMAKLSSLMENESHPVQDTQSTGEHLQRQAASPKVCEGAISQVHPSCCFLTVQPALLPVDPPTHTPNQLQTVQSHYPNVQFLHLNVKRCKYSHQCVIM